MVIPEPLCTLSGVLTKNRGGEAYIARHPLDEELSIIAEQKPNGGFWKLLISAFRGYPPDNGEAAAAGPP